MSNVIVYDILGKEVGIGDTVVIPQQSELKAYKVTAVDPDTNRIGCAWKWDKGTSIEKISLSYTWREFIKIDLKIEEIKKLRNDQSNEFKLYSIDFF